MKRYFYTPTGKERHFSDDDIIVSKTDLKGIITYANKTFLDVSGYTSEELIGKNHNILRHPDMPACVFRFLWDNIKQGKEVFAYVINTAKGGDHYWVFAHVTPSYDQKGKHIGYHSNRRVPDEDALNKVKPLYRALLEEEKRHGNKEEGIRSSLGILVKTLEEQQMEYDQFVFSLSEKTSVDASI